MAKSESTGKKPAGRAQFMKSLKTVAGGAWDEAREVEAKSMDLPYGTFYARAVKVAYNLDKNGKPYFQIFGSLLHEDEDIHGTTFIKSHFITPPKPLTPKQKAEGYKPKTVQEKLEKLSEDFQKLGIETSGTTLDELMDAADDVKKVASKDPYVFKVRITENKGGGDPWINLIQIEEDDPNIPDFDPDDSVDDEDEPDDSEDSTDDEDEPIGKSSKSTPKGRGKKSSTDDDEDSEDDDEVEEDEPPKSRQKSTSSKSKKPADDYDDEDDGEDDDDEEEEKPKSRRRPGK